MLKETLKESLLQLGLYYKINGIRFRNDPRNSSQRAFYSTVISKDDTVFDVGANVGQRTQLFAELARRVIAVEPQPLCLKHLRSRFRFNRNVIIENLALSDREGEATMCLSDSHTISSMSRKFINVMKEHTFRDSRWDKEITVPTNTLDHLIEVYGVPKFVKIDVEGFEINVLKGLTVPVPFISFEFTPELMEEARACVERIREVSADYRFNYCLGEDLNFVLPEHADYSTFMNVILPGMGAKGTFGDIYAIHEPGRV
jgi:FkbM family methyltransferase